MSSLQGITVAISPSGIQYFTQTLLADKISAALQGITPPDNNIDVGDILLSSSKGGSSWAHNVKVALSSGSMAEFSPTLTSVTQQDNGQFTMIMEAKNFKADYKWHETYENQFCGMFGCQNMGNQNNTYDYSVGFGSMTITIVFEFSYADSQWKFTLISATPSTSGISPNIPSHSIVNSEEYSGCFSTTVSDSTKNAVQSIDFATPINTLMGPLFQSIPASGNLTPDIVFEFALGPSGLAFPANAGITAGVNGQVTYKGTGFSGEAAPQIGLPSIPADKHLNFYAADYEFNALFWAFYQAGVLTTTATPGNIPDPSALNTSNYRNGPLQALYNAYPDHPMTAEIKAISAPTVAFSETYDLTSSNIVKLQNQLPPAVYSKLQVIKNQVYLQEGDFYSSLVNALGDTDADKYKSIIEAVAKIDGAIVSHNDQVVLNVIDKGNTIPVITFSVAQTDVLQNFALGIAGTTQTLQFDFQIITNLTSTKFISSKIPGIDGGDFSTIWNWALEPVYAAEVAKIGQAGVSLPRIRGFNFLFDSAAVTIESGYVSVLTDVKHVTDSGRIYLASKRRLDVENLAKTPWKPKRHVEGERPAMHL